MADFRVEVHKLTDADPDPENANLHTARGQQIVEESLRKRGAFRSLAAFGKGVDRPVIGAGNLTQETAIGIGMDEAIFVYSDGSKPIVHVRTDIAPGSKEARKLALEDNRAAEVSLNWDVGVVAGFDADVIAGLWSPEELSTLGQQWANAHGTPVDDPQGEWAGMPEFAQDDLEAWKSVKVNFMCQEDYIAFSRLVGQSLTEHTKFIWYPQKMKLDLTQYRNEDES